MSETHWLFVFVTSDQNGTSCPPIRDTLLYILCGIQAAAVAYEKAVETHPSHASILCKYGGFAKHVENDYKKVIVVSVAKPKIS